MAQLFKVIIAAALCAAAASAAAIDLQGHRGARGLAPENTLAAFSVALSVGVTTLETDLALTSDNVLVLSHDPRLTAALTRDADGRWLGEDGALIFSMKRDDLLRYDVGRLNPVHSYAASWTEQVPADGQRIPTLKQLFDLARDARTPGDRPVSFNIETKVTPGNSGQTPEPEHFARVVVDAIRAERMGDRVTVQSFDWRTLLEIRKLAPDLQTSCLTIDSSSMNTIAVDATGASPWHAGLKRGDFGGSLARMAHAAGCSTWAPFWRNVTADAVAEARALGLKLVVWTVNDAAEIQRLAALGVDGIITDYPDRARRALSARNVAVE